MCSSRIAKLTAVSVLEKGLTAPITILLQGKQTLWLVRISFNHMQLSWAGLNPGRVTVGPTKQCWVEKDRDALLHNTVLLVTRWALG